ncbi:GNAT family N-acetyltransferase [Dinghuibacter silviterrae]|uniref:ElaA protein n=1 Tax=Dinghuibacter silviterrae TaxID=1539049 RepID=A0A4R8DRG3_9BACT|nr:GNAT family N-acetyltransferase [Dinghuibacter silviterrae]TDX00398.1 ElaA protein [Dinghuibacter silviterrae]
MDQWMLKAFNDLTPSELYALLRLRSEVFVVEQNCVFLDMDGADDGCYHLMGWTGGMDVPDGIGGFIPAGPAILGAYARIVPPGLKFAEPSIGRVVTAPSVRGKGMGRTLIDQSLTHLYALYGQQPVRIGAQQYLVDFYGSFGFVQTGGVYMEDDIAHVEMVKR